MVVFWAVPHYWDQLLIEAVITDRERGKTLNRMRVSSRAKVLCEPVVSPLCLYTPCCRTGIVPHINSHFGPKL